VNETEKLTPSDVVLLTGWQMVHVVHVPMVIKDDGICLFYTDFFET
jgi:hypothetical protein